MKIHRIPFDQIPQLSKRDVAYNDGTDTLKGFYKYDVTLEAFAEVMADKKQSPINRSVLVEVLQEQYERFHAAELTQKQIHSLADENTFTIVTAHQPSLFTGPLYFVYKIMSAINLSRRLKAQYPEQHFVPVFVTGGEDHDFEEINHLHLFNKTIEWQNEEQGAVGMMKTASLSGVLEQLKEILGQSENATTIYQLIHDAHTKHSRYCDAVIAMVHALFGQEGLLVLNMNHPKLKRIFLPIIKEELVHQPSLALVTQEVEKLVQVGFKQQAMAREINFFYLKDQMRERIVQEDGLYKVLNTDLQFSEAEMLEELEKHPEHFSPNVVTRPLFQEYILPNLAYIGGGGELAYWMERQPQFQHFGINFPMLIRRNSVLWIDKGSTKKLRKFEITIPEFFEDTDAIIRAFVQKNASEELDFTSENTQFKAVYDQLANTAKKIDPTLSKAILAEQSKAFKSLEQLESRIVRAEKQKHEVALNQIRKLKDRFFPNNSLQERHDNFLEFYLKYGSTFFELLLKELDPLAKGFVVVVDEGG
ncbi:MAG: bacillithiol biosynthesis cysteine-adding enzyme BshC [Bacteroidota bacterium]